MSGQSIVDRLNAAKHTVSGSALGRAVVKATTEEIIAPKRKHLDYLLQCTSELNVSIPQMADLLIERTQNTSWVVTFKALITIHHLMCYGNERFSQYMASHNSKFLLNNFMDRSGTQGIDMSTYIRKYANYLSEKRETYKLMGFDFCKVKRGKEDGMLRTMNTEKLLKTLPILQKQLDSLVGFDVQPNELTNGVINSCFVLMSKDLIRLFACYNDGVINLLEKFFDMNKKSCKEALDLYKKFLDRTDKVSAFLKVAESSGMDKSDIPDLTKAPGSLLEALEAHVNNIENKKGGPVGGASSSNGGATSGGAAAASQARSTAVTSAINSLNNNTSLTEEEKQRVLDEEAKTLEQFKSNHLKKQASVTSPTSESSNPFGGSQNGNHKTNQNDLFGLDLSGMGSGGSSGPTNGHSSAANDLLGISTGAANPFGMAPAAPPSAMGGPFNMNPLPMVNNPFQAPVMMMPPQQQQPMNLFSPVNNNNVGNYSANNKMNQDLFDLNFDSTPFMSQSLSNSNIATAANYTDSTSSNALPPLPTGGTVIIPETSSFLGLSNSQTVSKSSENVSTQHHDPHPPALTNSINIGFSDFDAYGDVLQPTNLMNSASSGGFGNHHNNNNNSSKQASSTNLADQKILSNDLDSSLAILADNLAINKNNQFGKNHQWNGNGSSTQAKPTGGQNWKPPTTGGAQPMAASWNPSLSNTTTPMGGPPAQNWMNPNPFMAAPMPNQMNMQAQPQQQQTTVGSNNPFDLF